MEKTQKSIEKCVSLHFNPEYTNEIKPLDDQIQFLKGNFSKMASTLNQNGENGNNQSNMCRCGQGDSNVWINRPSDNSDTRQSGVCPNCQIIKSGFLHISTKEGFALTWSWKKRWFILTRTSLNFFRNDPNVPPIRPNELNNIIGGIDLKTSGSVVKVDKKLLTLSFDSQTFTLKAETTEDRNDWKNAIENALVQSPNASSSVGQNGIFRPEPSDQIEGAAEQSNETGPERAPVVGTPVMYALEDANGNPSFLEKALCFIEDFGIKVEGILRQSADVEEVQRRVHAYEQEGKNNFLPNEDGHVIGDCIKLVLREMPGYPVPAACCTALVETFRKPYEKHSERIDAMRVIIYKKFPEPNRLLLERILRMMLVVEEHKAENRMSLQALAACMAPLLLRALLVGDLEGDFNHSAAGENSIQLLQAAAAANHAQGIITTLLEEFETIFDDEEYYSDDYTDSEGEEGDKYHEGSTDNEAHDEHDDDSHEDDDEEEEYDDDEHDEDDDDHSVHSYDGESNSEAETDLSHNRVIQNVANNNTQACAVTQPKVERVDQKERSIPTSASSSKSISSTPEDVIQNKEIPRGGNSKNPVTRVAEQKERPMENQVMKLTSASGTHASLSRAFKLSDRAEAAPSVKRPTAMWGRTSARKNLSMESIEMSSDDEAAVEKLESTKMELQTKLAKEKKENEALQASLERRKESLQERRSALEKEVEKLREQLKQEKKLRSLLESGLAQAHSSGSFTDIDNKVMTDLEEVAVQEEEISSLKQKVLDLRGQCNNNLEQSYASLRDFCNKKLTKDAISKKAVLSDESDSIFEDFIETHGLPAPCPPENKRIESATEEHPTLAQLTKSKNVPCENEKRNLPPKSGKSGRSSSSSSFGDDIAPSEKQENNNNINNGNANAAPPKQPTRRFFSRGDNSKREYSDGSHKQIEEPPVNSDLATVMVKKSSSSEAGPIPPFALAKLKSRLIFLKERKAHMARELDALCVKKSSQ